MLAPNLSDSKQITEPVGLLDGHRRFRPATFFQWNRKIALQIEKFIFRDYNIEASYRDVIHNSLESGSLVLDIGGGARCVYATSRLRVIAADILLADLAHNRDIQGGLVADLEADFPLRPESVDAVTACYFVEHVQDTERLFKRIARILRPGGKLFILFPCRYAPFAIVNRMIPNRVTNRLLHWFLEDSHGGFPARYDNCWPKRVTAVMARNGLDVVSSELSFYQSHYYASFLPIYAVSVAYDLCVKALNLTSLAASACLVAEKRRS
jgi:SAM-dependent methyltransferase